MYGTYNGIKQSRQRRHQRHRFDLRRAPYDQYNSSGSRNNYALYRHEHQVAIGGNGQCHPGPEYHDAPAIRVVLRHVPSTPLGRWPSPSSRPTSASLPPSVQVYNSSLSLVGQARTKLDGGERSASRTAASRAVKATTSRSWRPPDLLGTFGGYGLLVNFGSQGSVASTTS